MRKVELRMNELKKYETVRDVVKGKKTKNKAQVELSLTRRQINRLVLTYKEYGKKGFVHGNRDRKPSLAISEEIKDLIEDLYITKYFDCTYTLFTELLSERENIHYSVDCIRNILIDREILSPKCHRKTKKLIKKKLQLKAKNTTKQKEKLAIASKIVAISDARPTQPRCSFFGEEIQMDTSHHIWFGKQKAFLHAAIDDSTGKIVGAYFDSQETLKGYYTVTKQILENYRYSLQDKSRQKNYI